MSDVDEESEKTDKINIEIQDGLESEESETDERDQIEISDLMKRIDSQKRR